MDITPAIPEIFLLGATCVVLLMDLFLKDSCRIFAYLLSLFSLLGTAMLVLGGVGDEKVTAFNGMYILDPMAIVLKIAILFITAAVFIYAKPYLQDRKIFKGEFYTLGLFATLGMMIMVSANSMLVLYLGLELLSLSLYAMVAFWRDNGKASEAAMKYFVLGAIASGMLLYGMSILYGLSGHIDLPGIAAFVSGQDIMKNVGLLFGLTFIIVGLGFKLGAVPFHMWVPDVYQGSPTAVTLFLSSAPKIAAFAMMMRLLVNGMEAGAGGWQQMLILLAVLSLFLGNIIAIAQTNLKRMFAYSTISHMGFVLMRILSASQAGYSAAMFYAITYAIIAMGGFAIIILLSREGFEAEDLADLRGLNDRHPWYAFLMMLFLFGMAGVPPMVGFYAKLSIIQSVVQADMVWLAVFAVVMSVIGAFYYLRAIKLMYFDQADETISVKGSLSFDVLLSFNGLLVIGLGIFPGILMTVCTRAIKMSI